MSAINNPNPYARTFKTTGRDRARKQDTLATLKAELQRLITWYKGAGNIRELNLTQMTANPITDIPAGFLTSLGFSEVDKVILSENDFSQIPAGVRELKVKELVVDYCPNLTDLSGIDAMGVEVLEAEHCGFTAWPMQLVNSSVTHVNLIGNAIDTVPAYPPTLEEVYLSGVEDRFVVWCAAEGGYVLHKQVAGLPAHTNALSDQFIERPYIREDGQMIIEYKKEGEDMDTSQEEPSDPGFNSASSSHACSTPDRLPTAPETMETPEGFRAAWNRVCEANAENEMLDFFNDLV